MILLETITDGLKTNVTTGFKDICEYGFKTYKDIIFGIIIGLVFGWAYHLLIGNRALEKSYKNIIEAKDETINAYKALVLERLEKVQVEKHHEAFYKKIKAFFKKVV